MQGENGFACSSCCGNDVPRPILFFVAAKKNGSACSGCRDNDLPRPILLFVAAKKNGPPAVHPQRQPKSRLRLVRCCSDSGFHGFNLGIAARITRVLALGLQRFLISGGKLANSCRVLPVYTLQRAVILDFRGSIWESLQGFPRLSPLSCIDS